MAKDIPMVLVSAEYRLALENPWPASLNDCVTVAKWVRYIPFCYSNSMSGANRCQQAMNEFTLELNLDVTSGLVLSGTFVSG